MRHRSRPVLPALLTLLSILASDVSAQRRRGGGDGDGDGRGGGRERHAPIELTQFTSKVVTFPAPSVGQEKGEYRIYLPQDYDAKANAERRYPWALWLHGMRGSHGKFHANAAAVLDRLRAKKKIPDMILVVPNASSSRSVYINRGKGRADEDLILVDVWNHVTANFRVSAKRHERAILGVSMGAMAAMKMALKYPAKFGAVAVHSSPVLPADPEDLARSRYKRYAEQIFGNPIDAKEWAKEIPLALLQQKGKKAFAGLRIYFDAGSADRYGFGPPNVELSKTMTKLGIEHTFRYIEGGGHSWASAAIQHAMQFSLPFVGASFARESAQEAPAKEAPAKGPPAKETKKAKKKDKDKQSVQVQEPAPPTHLRIRAATWTGAHDLPAPPSRGAGS